MDWSDFLKGAAGVFVMGKKINENIEAWLEIGGKIKRLFKTIKPSRIDENAATLLFLGELSKSHDLSQVKVSVQIIEGEAAPWGKGKLDKVADRIYLITATFPSIVYIYGITASGKERFKHEYDLNWYSFLGK